MNKDVYILVENCFEKYFCISITVILRFLTIFVSKGSATTQLRCGGIVNNYFIANCIESVSVKEF